MDSVSGSRSIPNSTQTDEAFDAFWEEEARNPHRNRIRIGRTYQASIPPKLKQGESDGRKLEDLETIYWHKQPLSKNEELNEYFSVAKLVSLFTRHKMFEKSKADRELQQQHLETNNTESSVGNNGISCKSEVTNGCVNDSHRTLDQQLIDIYNFVSSHHPPTKDEGCSSSSSTTSSHKDEWTIKEARIFASALEVYGKNFGAIKKAIPWKPVKSLMEHYYSSNEDGTSDEDDDYISPKDTEFLSAKSKNFQTLTVATCLTTQIPLLNGHDFSLKGAAENSLIIPGQEVKALKAKPVMKNQLVEPVNGHSVLGSLKFFMDGQLVLKLNAKQQETSKKCSWVESLDTLKIPKPVIKNKLPPSKIAVMEGKWTDSGRSSARSEDTGEESSDDDSMESADSRSLPSPSLVPRFRNSKVKVESNSQIPLPSTFFVSSPNSAVKDNGNESSMFKSDQKRVSENHALLLPEAKKRFRTSPKPPSDPSHDLDNESKVNMKMIQERLQFPSLYSPFRSNHVQSNNSNMSAVDLSCKPSPNSKSSLINHSGAEGSNEKSMDVQDKTNGSTWLQSYLPYYEQYYRYCSQSDELPSSSRRAAQSVSPPNSTSEQVELPSRPKSTSSTTPSPKEKRKCDWNKKSPSK